MESFRQYLPQLDTPRFQTAQKQSPYEYSSCFAHNKQPLALYDLTRVWEKLLDEPFKGVTNDGRVRDGLFTLQDGELDIDNVFNAATDVLSAASTTERAALQYPLAAREWRCWSNPEFLLRPFGLRLEEVSEDLTLLILKVLESTLSSEGYQKALSAMRVNHFLGELVKLPNIMNKYSYNFLLFGTPSKTEAWGWSLYGHHLCMNVFLKGGHISITPTFTGAEPNVIDEGAFAGSEILHVEGILGLHLMQSLDDSLQTKASIYTSMFDPGMLQSGSLETDRWNADDQRHVCGAFRDNRVVPYEGIPATSLSSKQQKVLLEIVEQFVLYLPLRARQLRLDEVVNYLQETFFSWIGGCTDNDAYYFRIQSPVIICEFDHHSGVFLTNKEPAKFHVHTLVRTPNGGDYGNALRSRSEALS